MTLLLAVALLGSACKSKEQGAREEFSETYTCPLDRVEVRARPDVKKSDLAKREDPPPDIEADPGRLQLWRSKRDEQRKREREKQRRSDSDPAHRTPPVTSNEALT